MTTSRSLAVVLDPSCDLAETVGRIEEWFLFADPDTDEDEIAVRTGAAVAGALCVVLRDAGAAAPDLLTPDGRVELAPVQVIPVDLGAAVGAMHRAVLALPHQQAPPGMVRALDLLNRCAQCSRSEDGVALMSAVGRRGNVKLSAGEYRAHEHFARAVLVDPLDRFIAMPPTSAVTFDPDPSVIPAALEVDL